MNTIVVPTCKLIMLRQFIEHLTNKSVIKHFANWVFIFDGKLKDVDKSEAIHLVKSKLPNAKIIYSNEVFDLVAPIFGDKTINFLRKHYKVSIKNFIPYIIQYHGIADKYLMIDDDVIFNGLVNSAIYDENDFCIKVEKFTSDSFCVRHMLEEFNDSALNQFEPKTDYYINSGTLMFNTNFIPEYTQFLKKVFETDFFKTRFYNYSVVPNNDDRRANVCFWVYEQCIYGLFIRELQIKKLAKVHDFTNMEVSIVGQGFDYKNPNVKFYQDIKMYHVLFGSNKKLGFKVIDALISGKALDKMQNTGLSFTDKRRLKKLTKRQKQ